MTHAVARLPIGKVVVLIPTYNERENLPLIVSRTRVAVPDADVLVLPPARAGGRVVRQHRASRTNRWRQ